MINPEDQIEITEAFQANISVDTDLSENEPNCAQENNTGSYENEMYSQKYL